MRIALCQIDATVGDLAGNEETIVSWMERARDEHGAQLALFPELALTGYPPEDLLLKEHFLAQAGEALHRIAARAEDIVAFVGFPERARVDVFNACAVLADGAVQAVYRKVYLPNYGVFDEQRYFASGDGGALFEVGDVTVGLTICEDIWEPGPPLSDEALAGASLIVNVSASPYHSGKGVERERMIVQRARDSVAAVAFCALVGGQDELVFDGHSLLVDHEGEILARAGQFTEQLLVADIDPGSARSSRLRDPRHRPAARFARRDVPVLGSVALPERADDQLPLPASAPPVFDPRSEVYEALKLGLGDYVLKNGFGDVVLGLSGGIDSALVAYIAVDALGPERVHLVIMPSRYSSSGTQQDARDLAAAIGVEPLEIEINAMMDGYDAALERFFAGREPDITEENIQARVRGNLLMALSNKFNWLVLTTGNKSEMSVGYSTLYGDLAGGLAVIKDVPKTLVYELSRWRQILPSIIERPPSAELRAGQRDEDSLPPYSRLDPILDGYVEEELDAAQIVRRGYDRAEVERVIALVDRAEYKRRQAPPGIRISTRAFGRDRRMPITNRYRG